jgi:23S rRNA-/tRNA-specific pseudouridylate synthase
MIAILCDNTNLASLLLSVYNKVRFYSYIQPVVVDKWSKNAVKRGEVKVFRVEHRTLYRRQNLASLVEIWPSATKWHFLRAYLAHLRSPVLGDNLYGSRVRQVMGVPLSINPCSDAARGPKVNNFVSSE